MKRMWWSLLSLMVLSFLPARAQADGFYLAGLGGAVIPVGRVGEGDILPGLALRVQHETGRVGYGLEAAYRSLPAPETAYVTPAADGVVFPAVSPRITDVRAFSLMASVKLGVDTPPRETRLFLIASTGVQDRVSFRRLGGDPIDPVHDMRFGMAFGVGLEGTGRVAPSMELRTTTIPEKNWTSVGVGMLVGISVRP